MRPSSPQHRTLQLIAVAILALAFWVSGTYGFMHHHHDDFRSHGDCAVCKAIGSSAALPDSPSCDPDAVAVVGAVRRPVPEAFALPTRLLRLRAPSTSPPVFPV
ncbi:hypothetical protein KKD52_16670 [Myxococcota bacterium]|nr:hypothetical protein [Myxococcota bacterium]MBU1413746.1 hypothetical protein [Myxococcota bacterium]MBU1511990.1 hypothetical protein [Myxococcota bacterium]